MDRFYFTNLDVSRLNSTLNDLPIRGSNGQTGSGLTGNGQSFAPNLQSSENGIRTCRLASVFQWLTDLDPRYAFEPDNKADGEQRPKPVSWTNGGRRAPHHRKTTVSKNRKTPSIKTGQRRRNKSGRVVSRNRSALGTSKNHSSFFFFPEHVFAADNSSGVETSRIESSGFESADVRSTKSDLHGESMNAALEFDVLLYSCTLLSSTLLSATFFPAVLSPAAFFPAAGPQGKHSDATRRDSVPDAAPDDSMSPILARRANRGFAWAADSDLIFDL